MNFKKRIRLLTEEAEIYRKQGLLGEALDVWRQMMRLMEQRTDLRNKSDLIEKIRRKIGEIENEQSKVLNATSEKKLSPEVQNLIKNKFAFSGNSERALMEGAVALAKFGQYERAVAELRKLISNESLRMDAAKNILRCHITSYNPEKAVHQYSEWLDGSLFTPDQMIQIRNFLQILIEPLNEKIELPEVEKEESDQLLQNQPGAGLGIDITSISISFNKGNLQGQKIDLDVSFQSGGIISSIINDSQKSVLENIDIGQKLESVLFYTPFAVFPGESIVFAKKKIEFGPRKGQYSLDLKLITE